MPEAEAGGTAGFAATFYIDNSLHEMLFLHYSWLEEKEYLTGDSLL
jgi:hypothetical protein